MNYNELPFAAETHDLLSIQEKCHQYWPTDRSARYQYFVVDPMAEYNMPQYVMREFKITDARVSQLYKLYILSQTVPHPLLIHAHPIPRKYLGPYRQYIHTK